MTWSGPSAGMSQCRVLLSGGGGESWTLTASNPSPVSDVYGAGFLNDQVGFVCSRHFLTTGPEILWTRDGGASWSPLELPIPEEYQGSVMDAYSPRFQDGEVRFPVRFAWLALTGGKAAAVSAVSFDENSPLDHSGQPSIVLRMVSGGERLWDIAKAYGTTARDVMRANALEEEELPDGQLLLIPRKR